MKGSQTREVVVRVLLLTALALFVVSLAWYFSPAVSEQRRRLELLEHCDILQTELNETTRYRLVNFSCTGPDVIFMRGAVASKMDHADLLELVADWGPPCDIIDEIIVDPGVFLADEEGAE